jgi:hypothetical protein
MDENLKAAIEKVLAEKSAEKKSFGADPRPTDLDVFFMLLPSVIGGYVAKSADSRSALSSTFATTREAVGQCCIMGIARVATLCNDGSHLAITPQGLNVPGVQGATPPGQDRAQNGVVVAQYPNGMGGQQIIGQQQPGPGGMVAQYPTNSNGQNQGIVQGGAPIGQPAGNGFRGVMTAMFPNDPNVHPIAPPQQQGR